MDLTHSTNQLYMLSTLNSLRTGNPLLDGIFILLLPTIMNYISQFAYLIIEKITEKITKSAKKLSDQDYYIQQIECSTSYGDQSYTNHHLYTAVCMYINHLKLDIKIANIESIFCDPDRLVRGEISTRSDQLNKLKFVFRPSIKNWITADTVEIMFEKNQIQLDSRQQQFLRLDQQHQQNFVHIISIRSRSLKSIENFIKSCIDFYKNEINASDDKRYMYIPKYKGSNEFNRLTFDSYVLNDNKTFDSLFIPDKLNLINLLSNFQNRTGKYSIPGVKQQLGLLLHGIPGSGKTSLIKSIANMFNRNIVTISLSLITTNYELFDLMFNLNYNKVDNQTLDYARQTGEQLSDAKSKMLTFENIIFVIEDIDAVSNIVHERENKEPVESEIENEDLPYTPDDLHNLARGARWTPPPPPLQVRPIKGSKHKQNDKLNLAGILNAIDGIIDAPGRMIIITSNFPERLDRALIRPGRIDKILKLDYILEDQAIEMCNHFFGEKTVAVVENELREIISAHQFTPAQIEQFALETNDINDFIISLNYLTQLY